MRGFTSSSEIKNVAIDYTFRPNSDPNKKNVLMKIDVSNNEGWCYFKLDNKSYSKFP
jgi:hypothetical protein